MCWKILRPYHINILKRIPSPSENINDCLRSKFRGVKLRLTRLSTHTCLTPKCMLVLLELPSGHLGMKTKQISKLDVHFILCVCVCARARAHTLSHFSHVRLFVTPCTVAHRAPLSMEFSRQEYWSGLPFPSPGDLPDPWIEPGSPALQAGSLPSEPPRKLLC